MAETINTGKKFFGLRIWLDSTGSKEVDKAAKTVFADSYWKSSIPALRPDVRLLLDWSQRTILLKAGNNGKDKRRKILEEKGLDGFLEVHPKERYGKPQSWYLLHL